MLVVFISNLYSFWGVASVKGISGLIRGFMQLHSQSLNQDWSEVSQYRNLVYNEKADEKVPDYFTKPLHGLENGGICPEQALEQSVSMRYIMRVFQGDEYFRERIIEDTLKNSGIEEIDSVIDLRVLDIGCGSGDSSFAIQNALPFSRVFGIDLSNYMVTLANARKLSKGSNVQFLRGDAIKIPFHRNSVDVICSFAMFHEMPQEYSRGVIFEVTRVLRNGGLIYIWDQYVSAQTMQYHVEDIEPFLSEYAQLNMSETLAQYGFKNITHTIYGNMASWQGFLQREM